MGERSGPAQPGRGVGARQVAGRSLAVPGQPSTRAPWLTSEQADLTLQMAGINTGYDQAVLRGAPDTEQYSLLYCLEEQLIAVEATNSPRDRILERGGTVPPRAAAAPTLPLKEFLRIA
ncbi:oxidoreductase C-terminal domain-containing protein [Streptomyces sp. NPDC101149]|uniref:oxidoreductase C-terminal domain-containing protein n=1 Tax=Streptomyces sp. NPDC101149 TaxID=3366113 RepID=UPI0038184F8B